MSKQIDERVVNMQFNNQNFEKNVKTSMSTLEKLKQLLNFGKETKSLDQLQRQADSIKFNGLADTLETVVSKFKGIEMAATLTFYKIADAAANASLQIIKSLTIAPIAEGYKDYGRKLTSIQTITNATGKSVEEVSKYFKELDTYADKTIYNLDDMTSSFAKFTNAGVDLDKSVPAIKGIANMVAVAGQDANAAQIAMYNLSQSIAGGFLTTIDYKSLNLANVATVEWKQNMADAAVAAGKLKKNKDGLYTGSGIKEATTLQGLFNTELDKQWATTDILLKVLGEYGDETTTIGKKAQAAAQDVKSYGMMMDTLKASVGTGWTDTFEILIGNLEESKALFTPMTKAIGGFLDGMSESRNKLLKDWKDLGGRNDLLTGLTNSLKAFGAILKPIGEAFKEIFPAITGKRLAELTDKFKEFTSRLMIGEKTTNKIKATFKGLFSITKTGYVIFSSLVKAAFSLIEIFLPLGDGILTVTAALGKWLEKTTRVIRDSNIINKAFNTIVNTIKMVIKKIGEFLKETLKFENIITFFNGMFSFIQKIGLAIGKVFASIIRNGDLKSVIDIFNTGLFGGLIITVAKLFKSLIDATKNLGDTFKGIKSLLNSVKDILKAYTEEINSKTLLNIAKAVALLAASLFILSLIPAEKITSSLGALAGIMAEFMLMFKVFTKISGDVSKVGRSSLAMISMSLSILILAGALKKLGSLDTNQIMNGLLGVAGSMTILIIALDKMPSKKYLIGKSFAMIELSAAMWIMASALKKFASIPIIGIVTGLTALAGSMFILVKTMNKLPKNSLDKSASMILLSISLLILGKSLQMLSKLSWSDIARSLTAMGGALLILTIMINKMPTRTQTKDAKTSTINMITLTVSMVILAKSLQMLSKLSWSDIARSLTAMGGALALLVASMYIMKDMKNSSTSLLAASAALMVFAIGMRTLSKISWEGIGKSVLALTIGIGGLVVAARLLTPVIGTLLAISGAAALFGVACVAFGWGLILISTGIGALAIALSGGAAAIVAGLSAIVLGILGMVPEIIKIGALIILGLAESIIELSPILAKALGTLIYEAVKMLADYIPMIVTATMDLIIKTIRAIADKLPELIVAGVELLNSLFSGLVEAFKIMDPKVFINGIKAIGLLTIAFLMMAALAKLFPQAMFGVLAFGVLVTELALVITAISKLINGTSMTKSLIDGGNTLMLIGTAIGKFIGGIVGGIGAGISNSLPSIATNLSKFMNNLEPFIVKASNIDKNIIDKITSLSAAILILTAANFISGLTKIITFGQTLPNLGKQLGQFMENITPFIDGANEINPNMFQGVKVLTNTISALTGSNIIKSISSFLTGGSKSFEKFGIEIANLGLGIGSFAKNLGTFNDSKITTIETACKGITVLAEASKQIPNQNGLWGWLAGDNSIGKFSKYLPKVAGDLSEFATKLKNFNASSVNAAVFAGEAIAKLAQAAQQIPRDSGMWGWLIGDNSIAKFAKRLPEVGSYIKEFADKLGNFKEDKILTIDCAGRAILALAETGNKIPKTGSLFDWLTGIKDIKGFSENLPIMGKGISSFIDNLKGFSSDKTPIIESASNAIISLANASDKIPTTGSCFDWLTGIKDIAGFTKNLPLLGIGLSGFATNLSGFDISKMELIKSAADALLILGNVSNSIPATGSLFDWLTGIKDIKGFTEKLPLLGTGINSFATNLSGFDISKIEIINAASEAIVTLAEASTNIPKSGSCFDWLTGVKDVKGFSEILPMMGYGLSKFVSNLGTFGEEQINTINSALEIIKILTGIGKVDTKKINEIVSIMSIDLGIFGTKVTEFVNKMEAIDSEKITKSIEKFNQILYMLKTVSSINIKSLETFGNSLKEIGNNALTGFVNTFSGQEPKNKASQGIRDLLTSMLISVESKREELINKFKSLFDSALSSIQTKDYNDKVKSAGKYFAQGFANGINEHRYLAINAGSKLGTEAYLAAKKAIDSNSPSKKTYQLGGFFGQGFVNGIKEYASRVYDESYNIGDKANKGLNKGISNINSLVDDSLNGSPTITPILDLTNIKSGASSISGMLNNLNANASLNAISIGMNRKVQNGMNDDVVAAINKLGSTLNTPNNTYNINGVTYGADGEISDAIGVLLRAANVERRI